MRVTLALVIPAMLLMAACSSQPQPAATETSAAQPAAADEHANMPGMTKAPSTPEEMIASAMSAAPEALSKDATIVTFDEKMQMQTLRTGTNGWTCIPDMASTPGPDAMCLDANGMAWAGAWMEKKDPPADKMGFGYMLAGGSDASNTDPFATAPAAGEEWVSTGPHVMVFNIGDRFAGYPTTAENTAVPYVMFAGTPYAHLMLPVK